MMSKELENFTPLIDEITAQLDLIASAVYGVVWRYCQMRNNHCTASVETVGEKLGVARSTVERHLAKLCELGYIQKESRPGMTNIYTVTDLIQHETVERFTFQEVRQRDVPPTSERRTTYVRETYKDTSKDTSKETNSVSASPSRATAKKPKNPQPAAVKVFRSKAHRFPSKCWWEEVDAVVGDDPADLERWGEVVFNWCGLGWNPTNVKGMLDCFKKNETPGDYANNGRPNGKANSGGRISGSGAAVEGRVDPGHFATGLGPVITEEMLRANREGRLDDLERLIAGGGDDGQADGSGLPAV